MRIRNWLGAGTLASAACLLAACYGGDPSAMTEAELGGYGMPGMAGSSNLAVTPAVDLSKGAACVEAISPLDIECPGLSRAELGAVQAAVQPKLMSLAPLIRVTVMRTGGQVFARIDGGEEHGQAFERTFGTSSLVVPVQADGSFQIAVPVAESEGRFGGMGTAGGGFGMQQPMLGGLGQFGTQPGLSGMGGGPAFGGLQPGLTGQLGAGGLLGQGGFGAPTTLSSPFGGLGSTACPCPGATPQVTYNAYGVEARLRGQLNLASIQFVPDATGQTETAVLVDDQALQMQGEIGLVPVQPGLEPGIPGGQQAVPPLARRALQPSQAGSLGGQLGAPQFGGAFGGGGQLIQTTPQAGIGQQVFQGAPQQACPVQVTQAQPAVECRIPLQMCSTCGVDTGAAEPTIITAPNIPEPACPQLILRPVQAPCPCR